MSESGGKVRVGKWTFVVIVILASMFTYGQLRDRGYLGESAPDLNTLTGVNPESPFGTDIDTRFGNSQQLNLFMYNGLSGVNIGDGATDEIYIYEVADGGSFADPSTWESDGGRETVLPDSDGSKSSAYGVGQKLVFLATPATEQVGVWGYTVPEVSGFGVDYSDVRVPVYTKVAAETDKYETDEGNTVSASVNMSVASEGGDGEVTLTATLRSGTDNAADFVAYTDPSTANKRKHHIGFVAVRCNVSALIPSGSDKQSYDGTYWIYWYRLESLGISYKLPAGAQSYLTPIHKGHALIDEAGQTGNVVEAEFDFTGLAANQEVAIIWDYDEEEQNFGSGTPTGDASEVIAIGA